MNRHVKTLVKSAMLAALCCAATLISIPLPGNGYANLGDALVICTAFFAGPLWGALAAAVGSALSDVILSYVVYAPATFIIKGLVALCFGLLMRCFVNKKAIVRTVMTVVCAIASEAVMVGGYFVFEWILYDRGVAVADLPGNGLQAAVAIVLAAVLISIFSSNKRIRKYSPLISAAKD